MVFSRYFARLCAQEWRYFNESVRPEQTFRLCPQHKNCTTCRSRERGAPFATEDVVLLSDSLCSSICAQSTQAMERAGYAKCTLRRTCWNQDVAGDRPDQKVSRHTSHFTRGVHLQNLTGPQLPYDFWICEAFDVERMNVWHRH